MVVGDDDQTIYTFNGASHEYILDFHKLFPDARTITLDINYRSSSSIVGLGNEVIRRNKKRKPKRLAATKSSEIAPRYYRPGDANEEAQAVIARVLEDVKQARRSYSDFAILYRSASDSRAMLEHLVMREIPFVHYGGGDVFYEQWMVKPVIDHMRLSLHRRNFEAMEGILPTLYINRDKGMDFIRRQEAIQRKKGPLAYLLFLPELKDFQKEKLKERLARIKIFAQMKPVDAIKEMRRTFYDAFLETGERSVLTPHKEVLKETLDELESAAKPFASVEAFVGHVEQMIAKHKEMERLRQDADADRVTVMTIHKSKGLEFPVVFVIGVSDGMLPHSSALEQPSSRGDKPKAEPSEDKAAALEEERRLAYVAITRAREELILSSPAYFRGKKAEVSQFILAPFRKASPPGAAGGAEARRSPSSGGSPRAADGLPKRSAAAKPPLRTVNETVYAWVCTGGGCSAWARISTQQETRIKDKACPLCGAPMRREAKPSPSGRAEACCSPEQQPDGDGKPLRRYAGALGRSPIRRQPFIHNTKGKPANHRCFPFVFLQLFQPCCVFRFLRVQNLFDPRQFLSGKFEVIDRAGGILNLTDLARSDKRRGHAAAPQNPGQCHLRQLLAALLRQGVQLPHFADDFFRNVLALQEHALPGRAGIRRNAVQIAVGQNPLEQRGEDDAADALFLQHVQQTVLDPAVHHRIARLMNQARRTQAFQNPDRFPRLLRLVVGNTDIECFALTNDQIQRSHRLLQRRIRVQGGDGKKYRHNRASSASGSDRDSKRDTSSSRSRHTAQATSGSPLSLR